MLAIPAGERSAGKASFLSQEIERGQKWQAEDGEMIRLDTLEQMHAITLDLIGADACHHGRTSGFEIGIEEPFAESTHDHARNLYGFVQNLARSEERRVGKEY